MFAFIYVVIFGLISLVLFDLAHVFSIVLIWLYYKYTLLFRRYSILDENELKNICLTTDLDVCLHMNNSRYLRDCDMARTKLWLQTGVVNIVNKLGGSMVLGASTVRYRKSINVFNTYSIKTKVLYWDSKAFYLEQQFVRHSDGFICCVVISKQSLVGVTTDKVINELGYPKTIPECPARLTKWIEFNQLSSDQLKKMS